VFWKSNHSWKREKREKRKGELTQGIGRELIKGTGWRKTSVGIPQVM
jgi:hypothetical protein